MKTNLLIPAFRRHQTGNLVASMVVAAIGLFLPASARAFSITGVTLTPASPVSAESNLVMTVKISTPSAPPDLYRPTTVSVQGNQVFVDLYPTSGLLTVIGNLSTNVNLGVLPGGTYQYEVRLFPEFATGWGVRTNRGSFSVLPTNPLPPARPPVVTIIARDSVASEGTNCYRWPGWPTPLPASASGPNTATFVVRRSGDTNANLTAHYQISGTASNGLDYVALPGTVVIPAGQRVASVTVWPMDDALPERIETVVLSLWELPLGSLLPPPYTVGKPGRAAAIIVDNDQSRPGTGRLPDHGFHLMQPGTNGAWFRIECSTDLVHWNSLCTNSVTDGAIHYVDPETDLASQRFYRVVPAPSPPAE